MTNAEQVIDFVLGLGYEEDFHRHFPDRQIEWLRSSDFRKGVKRPAGSNSGDQIFLVVDGAVKMEISSGWHSRCELDGKFLAWDNQEEKKEPGKRTVISLYDLEQLPTITNLNMSIRKLGPQKHIFSLGGEAGSISINASMPEGEYDLLVPECMRGLDELLVLAKSTADGLESNYFDKMSTVMYVVNFRKQNLTVVLQDWYNNGAYDFLYQYPYLVKRHMGTGAIYGIGGRLKPFMLDDTGKKIARWFD